MGSLSAIGFLFALLLPASESRACWEEAGLRHGVSPALLVAVASVESSMNPEAINRSSQSRTGSYDIGLMQVNSTHLPALGLTEQLLLEPCANIHAGASVLADAIRRHGLTWNAIGAYNAGCRRLSPEACQSVRSAYAWKVFKRLPLPSAANAPELRRASPPDVRVPLAMLPRPALLAVRVSP